MMHNILICGTRTKDVYGNYKNVVCKALNKFERYAINSIIEGCCPDSADVYAEEWAKENGILLMHHPSHQGNYLKRNIEMVSKATIVIAFWDGYSYGTAHTIAHATMKRLPVTVIMINNQGEEVSR